MAAVGRTVNEELLVTVTPLAVTDTVPVVAPLGTTATIDVAVQLVIEVAAVPLNFTVPCVVPKFEPAIVTEAPTAPDVGDRLLITGVATTVNEELLLTVTPLAVTDTVPVVAPLGTTATIDVAVQLVIEVAAVPLNFTVPFVVPKFDPAIVIEAPTAPDVGDRLLITGVATTVNEELLVTVTPLTVTDTVPVVAPLGTTATIDVAVQLVIEVADVPLNLTVPCVVPKFEPAIVTEAPTAPDVGDRLVIVGVARTVNEDVLVTVTPLAVTDTVPVVAPLGTTATIDVAVQLVIEVADVPLNLTVPCVVPKFEPAIVTEAPTAPDAGDRLLIAGVSRAVNEELLVTEPPLAVTATVPVVAPDGTTATIDVFPQLVIEVAVVPLNLTVPFVVPKFVPVIVTEAPTAPDVGDRLVIVGVAALI